MLKRHSFWAYLSVFCLAVMVLLGIHLLGNANAGKTLAAVSNDNASVRKCSVADCDDEYDDRMSICRTKHGKDRINCANDAKDIQEGCVQECIYKKRRN